MSKKRAYMVEEDGTHRLVNGISMAQVLRFVTKDSITIRVAKQDDFVFAMQNAIPLEHANQEEAESNE